MPVNVIQNFYLEGANFRDFRMPASSQADKQEKVVTNETKTVEKVAKEVKTSNKSTAKKWLLIAAWIITLFLGIGLAIGGGVTANGLMADLGTLIVTAMAGIGIKLFEKAFESTVTEKEEATIEEVHDSAS